MFYLIRQNTIPVLLVLTALLSCGGGNNNSPVDLAGSTAPLPFQVILSSNSPASGNIFGSTIAFSPDGNTLLVGENNGDSATTDNVGTAQIFSKSKSGWGYTQTLLSETPGSGGYFGFFVAFSPDGTTLAVAELFNGNGGAVNLYTQVDSKWVFSKSISSNDPTSGGSFGGVIAFNRDGSAIAVAIVNAQVNGIQRAGSVQIFTKISNWAWQQTLIADVPSSNNLFGSSLIFSSDGTTLAVGEKQGDTDIASNSGAVHLFENITGNWQHKQVLHSFNAQSGNSFGGGAYSTAFSPDSKTLIIGEAWGDPDGIIDAGMVQFFTKSINNKLTTWTAGDVLTANVPQTEFHFGISVSMSINGNTLAVGDESGEINSPREGAVHLFKRSETKWLASVRFNPEPRGYLNQFGAPVVYSPVGNELAIGEAYGNMDKLNDTGLVRLFDFSQKQ